MEEDIKGLGDYIAVLKRRKIQFIATVLVILIVSAAIALLWPPTYRSGATILIEQQEIPADLVRSTVTSYADQRIQLISQRVMTTTNLQRIIEQFGLYEEKLQTESILMVLEEMRDNISLEMITADVVDPKHGRPVAATIAFTISFDYEFPAMAQRVANELVTLFLNENLKQRSSLAGEASKFLGEEAQKLREQVAALEAEMAAFKEKNVDQLPELVQLNLQLMERTERELTEVKRQIRALEERRIYLGSELAQIAPNSLLYTATGERIFSPEDRLTDLQARFITASAVYAKSHPDLKKMRKEIAALKKETQPEGMTLELQTQLKDLDTQRIELTERYSDQHPDVKKIQSSIKNMQLVLDQEFIKGRPEKAPTSKPDNPAYIQLQAQLEAAESDLSSFHKSRQELMARLDDYERRIMNAPQVEKEYRSLSRDYENALAKYQEIKAKQMEAELAETLEKENKGERFSLIEPPQLPEEPETPNRLAIMFLGFVFSMIGGIGVTATAEALDGAIHGARSVIQAVGMPPLAVIPSISNASDRRRKVLRQLMGLFLVLSIIGSTLLLVHFLFMPLDVLWYSALRRMEGL